MRNTNSTIRLDGAMYNVVQSFSDNIARRENVRIQLERTVTRLGSQLRCQVLRAAVAMGSRAHRKFTWHRWREKSKKYAVTTVTSKNGEDTVWHLSCHGELTS